MVWLCENNGYSVSVPMSASTPVADLAIRAAGYGMPGVVVDGQDAVAVAEAVDAAVGERAAGAGRRSSRRRRTAYAATSKVTRSSTAPRRRSVPGAHETRSSCSAPASSRSRYAPSTT